MAFAALYLHIPFCHAKCAYCDFDSRGMCGAELERACDRYLGAVFDRIDACGASGALEGVQTVYVGGGTPTVLGDRLPELVRRVRGWCSPVEFTCEANPESLAPALADALRDAGVTRISLGVQSLDDGELRSIGRLHTADDALRALELARSRGFSVSCDLICGLPGQTEESWLRTLERAIAAGPHHVSVYPLTIEEGTPLAARAERDPSIIPDEDFQADCMELARDRLGLAGLMPYEVASYALPGHRCRHNASYWSGVPYLGIGRSAASMLGASEFDAAGALFPGAGLQGGSARARIVQTDDEGRAFECELLSERETVAEDLMLAMRMTSGATAGLMARARRLFGPRLDATVAKAEAEGLAHVNSADGSIAPTERGWLMGNELYGLMWGLAGRS